MGRWWGKARERQGDLGQWAPGARERGGARAPWEAGRAMAVVRLEVARGGEIWGDGGRSDGARVAREAMGLTRGSIPSWIWRWGGARKKKGRYDEDERAPLLLHCGHGFCRACLARMLAAAQGTVLPCPRCRHRTAVGNSVSALRKNFPILSLLSDSPSSPSFLHSDSGSSDDDEDDFFARPKRTPAPAAAPPPCTSLDLASHPDLKLARRIGSGPPGPAGQEVCVATLSRAGRPGAGGAKRCKHPVAVKRVPLSAADEVEGVQEEVERLRRASTWCRNVCTFHGTVKLDGHLCFVMDRYPGSVQEDMRQNGGRLTLEQILRCGIASNHGNQVAIG
ncbi:hypothetical protein ZWY2020_003364 [Hordeum vulgare]|nr:hypothetical protein ZWY2020_003364 [Hordeum vulgare]